MTVTTVSILAPSPEKNTPTVSTKCFNMFALCAYDNVGTKQFIVFAQDNRFYSVSCRFVGLEADFFKINHIWGRKF